MISNVINSLSHWGLLVILVKFFTTEDVGYFTFGTAVAAPIFMLSEMQMKSVLVVEPEGDNDYFKTYLFLRFLTATLALIGLIIYSFLYKEANWIIIAVVVYKAAESIIDILYGYLQKKDRMVWMSKVMIVKTLLTVIACFLTTIFFYNIITSLLSIIIVTLAFYFVNILYIKSKLAHNFNSISMSAGFDILKKCLPLGVSVLFGSYITNYPRITIEGVCGPELLAYFGAYSYFVIGIFQISSPVTTYLRQRLSSSYHKSNINDFKNKVNLSILFFILMGVLFIVVFCFFGKLILLILYNESYLEYGDVIYYLIFAQMILTVSSVYSTAILSFNIYTKQAFISFSIFSVVLLLSKLLIEKHGIYGGAYISLIAAIISVTSYGYIYYTKLRRWKREITTL